MKKVLLLLFIFSGLIVQAQTYNNEWINYSRTYYKFQVATTGLYRISQPALAGLGIGNIPAEQFQLWRNGKQIPMYTSVQTGTLSSSDYLEFWGERNDGIPDNALYRIPDHQINDKYSLETDTVSFFLTVNPSGNNLRLVPVANNLPSALPVEPFFTHTVGKYYNERYFFGYAAVVGSYVYSSSYENGEGFASNDIGTNGVRTEVFSNLFPYTGSGAPVPVLKVNASGNALLPRQVELNVNSNVVLNQTMDFFDYAKMSATLTTAMISSGTATIQVTNKCLSPNDRMVIGKTELIYARQFDFGGANNFAFELTANPAGNYLEINGFNHSNINPVLYDLTNGKRYIGDISNPSLVKVDLQGSSGPRKLIMVTQAPSYPVAITAFQQRNFVNYSLPVNQGDYLIISHPALMSSTTGSNPVEDYKAYRASANGGSYNAKIYLIDELVDQFGFGIKRNPIAVRNFIFWARNTFSTPVKNVFLIGKGLNYIHNHYYGNNLTTAANTDKLSFIPTFGYPASDILLAAEPGMDETPKVPIGRLSVIKGNEVASYLVKVKQYEQQQAFSSPLISDKAWMKNTVHVIGAGDGSLGDILTSSMNRFKDVVSDTFYGANVNTFSKLTSAPVEQANASRLYGLFEQGIGLMTYFGHSSATTLEFNLDNPDNYNNQGKYPLFILLGCNAGNFYNYTAIRLSAKETISEKYVLADQKGSIATIASTSLGIVHYLDIYNSRTMSAASVSHYGKTMGQIMNESISQVYNLTTQNDFYARMQCEQTTLHGDPALKLDASFSKPDYVIEDQLLKINPTFISVAENSFNVKAKFMNIGKAINKNIVIELKRTYPDLSTEVIRRDTIPGIRYIDSLSYDIPIISFRDKGLNKISICVDADNMVDELYETNNCISKDVFVYEDEIRPVYPYNYAIINKQGINLKASTANPFSPTRQYTMEIDTTDKFNSAFKTVKTVSSSGGLVEFNPGITFTDSTVYYWRVAPVPVTGLPVWNYSSFVYLANTDLGFNQSHYFQHEKSLKERITLDPQSRNWKFGTVTNNLFLRMGTYVTSGAGDQASLSVSVNGANYIRLTAWFQSLVFNVFDPVSFKPWQNQVIRPYTSFPADLGDGRFGSHAPMNSSGVLTPYNFEYRYTSPDLRKRMMDFMKDTIPDGYYVVVRNFTLFPGDFGGAPNFPIAYASDWMADESLYGSGKSLYHSLKNAGLSGIDSFYRPRPFGFVYKKNDPSFTPKWLFGEGVYDNPVLSVDCFSPDTLGYVTSPLYGPAKSWKQIKWRGSSESIGDTATIDVIGIRSNGSEQNLYSGLTTLQQDFDISSVNPQDFPFIRLKMRSLDNVQYTPYQLKYWRVTYVPVPEGAIAPNLYIKTKDTLDVGEPLDFKVAFKNVSEVSFDSLKIKMVITDKNSVPHVIPLPRRRPLPVSDTMQIGALLNTASIAGANSLFIEANPDNDQMEQYHFNNFAFRNIYVKPDSLNPLLDVTFDGVHILNRDIVSSKPEIVVKLKDEARWMILDDTSLLTLHIRYPNGILRRFYFNNDTLRFNPAGQAPNPDNTATINFKPYFSQDGQYEMIISGKDKSNNEAGNIEYRVIFDVINKPMISNMLNYPNPFTTSTAFVFTITGNEVPQNIKIEIMTVTGRIVREITKDELGSLHIGRNITEFKWDGTDQYGQKLANGIYLYRVVTNLNGKSLDKYKAEGDNTDKYFNKGYGKMYLMR